MRTRPRSISSVTGTKGALASPTRLQRPHGTVQHPSLDQWCCASACGLSEPRCIPPRAHLSDRHRACEQPFRFVAPSKRSTHFARVFTVNLGPVITRACAFHQPSFPTPLILSCTRLPTAPADLQQVNLTLRVLSRPDVAVLPKIYTQLGEDYDERVLPSIGNEVLKAVVARPRPPLRPSPHRPHLALWIARTAAPRVCRSTPRRLAEEGK